MHYIWQLQNWTSFIWNDKEILPLLSEVRLKQGKLIEKIKIIKSNDSIKTQAKVLIKETLTTALIEGERYDAKMVCSSVYKKLGLSSAGLPKSNRSIDGLVEILLDATQNHNQTLTAKKLKSWHAGLFPTGYSGLLKIRVGKFRDDKIGPMQVVSGFAGREKVYYEAPPANVVCKEIQQFLKWWKNSHNQVEGIIRAGIAHFYFITIHPFEDGNGRIARILTDMALAQDDRLFRRYYSLSNQILANKKRYYQILEETQKSNSNLTDWLSWFLDCFIGALDKSEGLMKDVLYKTKFWRKHQEKFINSRQRKVLNKLLDAGKGNFTGGLTTRKYVSLTKISRATAYREINDLVKKKMLRQNKNKGRSVSYGL